MDSTTTTATGMKPRYLHGENGGSSDEIKAGIEQTRAQMDGTIDALTERLRPRHLLDDVLDYFQSRRANGSGDGQRMRETAAHVKDQVKETATDTGRAIVRQIKRHPIPSLLIGAGIAWWLVESDEDEEGGYARLYSEEAAEEYYAEHGAPSAGATHEAIESTYASTGEQDWHGGTAAGMGAKMKDAGANLKARASEKMENVRRKAAERTEWLRHKAAEKGAHLKESAAHGYEQGVDAFKRTADEHPLAVGVGFLALGVLAGILLPSTRKEDELMGTKRDELLHRTREAAEEAVERGKRVAAAATDAVKNEAQQQGLTPEALKEKVTRVAEQAKETTRSELNQQKQQWQEA